jgi:4-amino-4-deoxy-L-arabinose transferase-like glycosyltransferase
MPDGRQSQALVAPLTFQYHRPDMPKRYGWLLIILFAAALLRFADLSQVPPGLTHDEANHGLDAWGVVNGVRPIYFTVGYGREPLFDYTTAILMTFLGPSYLAGRLTSAFISLILVAATYAWVRRAFNHRTGLLASAALAVSFWPVMTGRQALRSGTLPVLLALAAYFFWQALNLVNTDTLQTHKISPRSFGRQSPAFNFLIAGILLGLSIYAYIPARVMWLIFPGLLAFLAIFYRSLFNKAWRGTVLMFFIGALLALPLVTFLLANPSAETRLAQLSQPLTSANNGDFQPLWENTKAGLRTLTIEGDRQWRYNIPGRPILAPILALLFYIGLGLALWQIFSGIRDKGKLFGASAAFFALLWLAAGLLPVLITGAELSTTRIIGLQAVLYIFPALALAKAYEIKILPQVLVSAIIIMLFGFIFVQTVRTYFGDWANNPEVRVQYETTLISTMRHLNAQGKGLAAISTATPDRFHSPAAAFLTLDNPAVSLRWFNGQHSLLAPQDSSSTLIFSGFSPLNPHLQSYLPASKSEVLPLRISDLDRPITIFSANGPGLLNLWQSQISTSIEEPAGVEIPVNFDDTIEFLGYDLQTPEIAPGGEVRLATVWRVNQPIEEGVLFTQLLGSNGTPIAQSDRLDVPSYYWVEGDVFVQLHRFHISESLEDGEYPLLVGLYKSADLQRLPVMVNGSVAGDHLRLRPVLVTS